MDAGKSQSSVQNHVLHGLHKEQTADRCELDFHSVVIELVVKYCYCGELNINQAILEQDEFTPTDRARLLVELREAGSYFHLEEVRLDAERFISKIVFENSQDEYGDACALACSVLTELFKRGEDDGPIWSALLEFAAANPERCFGDLSLSSHPHAFVLEEVLEKIKDTFVIVKCLQSWFIREAIEGGSSEEEKQALVDLSRCIDLKKLSTDQLSVLFKERSCDLFPSDRILEALFHNLQVQQTQNLRQETKAERFYVSGAGMECLNGFYLQRNFKVFYRAGQYFDGRQCQFIIHYNSVEMRWKLSITATIAVRLDSKAEIFKEDIKFDAYEAAKDGVAVPFNSWKCLEANDQAPIVARIDG